MEKVKNILHTQNPKSLNPTASVLEAVNMMSLNRVSCIVVQEDESLVGIFTERDLKHRVAAQGIDYSSTSLSSIMTRCVETVGINDDILDCLSSMERNNCQHIPVMHNEKIVAVLSMKSVLKRVIDNIESERDQLRDYITS